MAQFDSQEIDVFCGFIRKEFGLNYSVCRHEFIQNRLEPLMQKYNLKSLSEMPQKCQKDIAFKRNLLNAITTNETCFFRHPEHFRILQKYVLPKLLLNCRKTGNNQIKIWSAGCSTGEELYSILFALLDSVADSEKYNIQLTGSDISAASVRYAQKGVYTQNELREVPPTNLNTYFEQVSSGSWQVKGQYAKRALFETLNLLDNWPNRRFNIIFCRNTMIYFSESDKNKLVERLAKALEINGFLFAGAGEMLFNTEEAGLKKLFLDNEIIYQKIVFKPKMSIISFSLPTELLRAMNALKNACFYFELAQIHAPSPLMLTRAICIKAEDIFKVQDLFASHSIKFLSIKIIKKSSEDL